MRGRRDLVGRRIYREVVDIQLNALAVYFILNMKLG